jgi:antirestriction protein ArdC
LSKYAFEELVAELTSAYLCAHDEIQAEMRHASYPSHYLKMIKYDDTASSGQQQPNGLPII